MSGPIENARELLREVWRGRWLAVGVAWMVSLVVAAGVLTMKDRYQASARVYIDTQTVLKPLMAGLAFQPDIQQQITMLARTLISRPNIELLHDLKDIGWDKSEPQKREQEIAGLMKAIQMGPGGGANVYAISYRDTDPQRAQRLVERLVKMFVSSGGDSKKKDSEDARNFIEEEIRSYEAKLAEAENKLKDYKLKNFGVTGLAAQDYFARMSALSDEVNKLRLEYSAAEKSRDALKRELSTEATQLPPEALGPQSMAAPIVSEHDARLEAAKKQLDELLRRYTEQHPDVIMTRRTIAQLEVLKRQDLEAKRAAAVAASTRSKGANAETAATNPVYQKIRFALAEAEASVASLRVRLGTQQARLAETRALASRVPQAEAELSQLNRDYDIIRKNYEQLVARRESASLGVKIDQTSPLAEFRLIEPPRTEPKPVFPNRLSLALLGVLLAAAAGIAAALLRSRLAPVVGSAKALRELSGRPVLGTVSLLVDEPARQRQRAGLLGLLGAIAALMLMQAAWVGWVAVHSRI